MSNTWSFNNIIIQLNNTIIYNLYGDTYGFRF